MKISIIGPVYPYKGGIAHFTSRLAQEIIITGHELQIISFARQYPQLIYPGKTDKDPSKLITKLQAQYILDPLYPWTWFYAITTIKNWKSDIVIFQWWTTFWAPAYYFISKFLSIYKIKTLFLIHNVLPHEVKKWDFFLAQLAFSSTKRFVTLSAKEKKRLTYMRVNAQIKSLWHPLYNMFSIQKISKMEARQQLGLSENELTLLFFGIIRPYKGLNLTLKTISQLREKGLFPTLLIAGQFWENINDYRSLINRLGISNQVIIENRYIPNEEVGLYFSAADIFLAPYLEGTQSGSVTIALSYGLPVIISKSISDPTLINNYKSIWVIDPFDKNQFIDALISSIKSLGNSDSRRQPEVSCHSWAQFVTELLDFSEKAT